MVAMVEGRDGDYLCQKDGRRIGEGSDTSLFMKGCWTAEGSGVVAYHNADGCCGDDASNHSQDCHGASL